MSPIFVAWSLMLNCSWAWISGPLNILILLKGDPRKAERLPDDSCGGLWRLKGGRGLGSGQLAVGIERHQAQTLSAAPYRWRQKVLKSRNSFHNRLKITKKRFRQINCDEKNSVCDYGGLKIRTAQDTDIWLFFADLQTGAITNSKISHLWIRIQLCFLVLMKIWGTCNFWALVSSIVAMETFPETPEVMSYVYQLWRHIYTTNDVT